MTSLLHSFRQNKKLPVRIVSPYFGHLTPEESARYSLPHHTPYYFFLLMLDGRSLHRLDLRQYEVTRNELIFVMPHQVHDSPVMEQGANFVKLGFDEYCLSFLPKQYPFLVDPFNQQKISFAPAAAVRVKAILAILLELLSDWHTEPELILAHLNSLLTEVNTAYFIVEQNPAMDKFSKFAAFKEYIENNFTDHPAIGRIAEDLGVNTNGLYQIVKQYSGVSPKEFITNRLILEARRRLYYTEGTSVKELAFELGFNDPEYFSRVFKKVTGQTVTQFSQDLSGN